MTEQNQGTSTNSDPGQSNEDVFMATGHRLAVAFNQITRANIQQVILEGLEKLTQDAEFFAAAATGKKRHRAEARAKQMERLNK